jgi:hypothetical protein
MEIFSLVKGLPDNAVSYDKTRVVDPYPDPDWIRIQ